MPNEHVGHSRGFATRAIWSGQPPCPATGATVAPIYQTSTFTLPEIGVTKGFDYSRTGNPTRLALERQLADLEGARFGAAFGSGMAAIAGLCSLLSSGDHVVAAKDIYGGTHRLLTAVLPRYGIATSFVDTTDVAAVRAAILPNTKLLLLETPSNPRLRVTDVAAIARLKRPGQIVAADNTFATPFFQRPLEQGADVVVHSTTKYLCGHSDVVGGIVITDRPEIHQQIAFHQNCVGAIPGPWDAYLTTRGAKTLALRMRAHARNAQAIAEFLASREDVADVDYPGLRDHPQHELARRQMSGFGGIVSFRAYGGVERARAIATSTRVFALAVSLGGVESLVCNPATMTHGSLTPEQRADLGIADDLLRLSVGVEDVDDLLADIRTALDVTQPAAVS
ncbi:MAG TPA: PLP-dependent aspartate aminotransferase family protein [Candidatus Acidoferrales bacterium]|nr:PLP-dependent aspartate aminotransferase family protein [Candidatus Acidoferrales bacterium]